MTRYDIDLAQISPFLRSRMTELVDPLIDLVRTSEDPPEPPARTGRKNLLYLLVTVRDDKELPMDKIQRWLGFVQGVLAARGIIDVDEERERTRIIFRDIYRNAGIEVPSSRQAD